MRGSVRLRGARPGPHLQGPIRVPKTGHGHADKESVDKAMNMMFGKMSFKTSDESDALAIAVCHALNRTMKLKMMGKSI